MGRVYLAVIGLMIGVIITLVVHIKGLWIIPGLEDKVEDCIEIVATTQAAAENAIAVSTVVAREGDEDHAENLAITTTAARAHIARNRLRPQISGSASSETSLPGSAGSTAAVPELDPGSDPGPMPEAPRELAAGWVAVKEEDVLICTADYELAWTAHDFIQDAKESGLMQPVTPAFPRPAFGLETTPAQ